MKKMYLIFAFLLISGWTFAQQTNQLMDDGSEPYTEQGTEIISVDNSLKGTASLPQYYNYDTPGGGNSFIWNQPGGKAVQLLYLPGDFNQPSPAPAGNITSLSFRINESYPLNSTYTDLTIKLGQANITSFPFGVFYTGSLTTVYYRASVTLTGIAGDWMSITLDTPFAYDPSQSLIVDLGQCASTQGTGYSSCRTLAGVNNRRTWSNGGCPFTPNSSDDSVYHIGFDIGAAPPAVPISNWPIYLSVLVIGAFLLIRYRRKLV